jgi:hypothetical protein
LQHEGVPADGGYLHPPLRHGEELTAVREHSVEKRWSQQRAGQCTRMQTTQHSTSVELACRPAMTTTMFGPHAGGKQDRLFQVIIYYFLYVLLS